jgi:hypothetical protein
MTRTPLRAHSIFVFVQDGFRPRDIPYKTIRTLDSHIRNAMLPGMDVQSRIVSEQLDGDQVLTFFYTDLYSTIVRMVEDPKYYGHLYHTFERQETPDGERFFQRANSGLIFECFFMLDQNACPVLIIIFIDTSYVGLHKGHCPIYGDVMLYNAEKCIILVILHYTYYIELLFLFNSLHTQFARARAIQAFSMGPCWLDPQVQRRSGSR